MFRAWALVSRERRRRRLPAPHVLVALAATEEVVLVLVDDEDELEELPESPPAATLMGTTAATDDAAAAAAWVEEAAGAGAADLAPELLLPEDGRLASELGWATVKAVGELLQNVIMRFTLSAWHARWTSLSFGSKNAVSQFALAHCAPSPSHEPSPP